MFRERVVAFTLSLSLLALSSAADAQFGSLLDSVKSKAADQIRQRMDGSRRSEDGEPTVASGRRALVINQASDFAAGTQPLVNADFSGAAVGTMPTTWKTNGSGEIVTIQGVPGKWLKLQNFASYKLANPPQLPPRFTVEFDIIVATDVTRDVGFIHAGFAKDNSVRTYMQDAYNDGAINAVTFGYAGDSSVASSATGYHHPVVMDMDGYANRVMHVAIAVDGDNERIYVDRNKIADARLFNSNQAKYFFISAPVTTEHDAKVLFGNFHIDVFR